MEYVLLKDTAIRCSRIALGTWSMGGMMWGGSDDQASLGAIRAALEAGINTIDTAPIYGFGHAEELVGKALEQHGRRDEVVIATKVGLDWSGPSVRRDSSRARIRQEIAESLGRLRTDYIDIYQVHWPDTSTPFEDTADELHRLLQEGKIRAIGVSNFSPEQMDAFRRAAPLHTSQPPYNLFEREIERDALPYCREQGITVLAYGPLCRGLLSGRMRPDTKFEGDDMRKMDPKFQPPRYQQYLEAVARLDRLAQKRFGKRVLHLAVRWLLDQPGVGVTLWGARRPEQLAAVNDCLGWSLDEAAMKEIENIIAETVKDPVGPEFMAPPASAA
ncbi:MAG TPA: aldo/keto reductase [Terriglobales bacterium]|jgi:aryl-alcohol dehydrogenase-like predicted oxidoreductase|nr:aldo/keto reductase [Terriglobales bacterium]